jgi:DNA mismatch repair ATPase MutS
MEIDRTTYNDLALFHSEDESSIFEKINFTRTLEGRAWLLKFFNSPFSDINKITETQQILKTILGSIDEWPVTITNGTMMVMERYYDSNIDSMPGANLLNAINYKLIHSADFSLVKYSIGHFADFFRGMMQLVKLLGDEKAPLLMRSFIDRTRSLIKNRIIQELSTRDPLKQLTLVETIYYGRFLKEQFRNAMQELIAIYGRLDAWYSLAIATRNYQMTFPEFRVQAQPLIDAKELYHLLLSHPVPYDVHMSKESNFVFLTGANMAGKSTFIKAVGTAVFLAHLGMGAPAAAMTLTIFDGVLSNINVVDNIAKGESFFFNEVQRIKNTIIKINDGRKWLVLIDELFKGTNVQDAMKCSSTVIKGLIKIKNSLFILSTHLYEIADELKSYPNISFCYFETAVNGDQLEFNYRLKEGISNDRLGYLILKKEKVIDIIDNL